MIDIDSDIKKALDVIKSEENHNIGFFTSNSPIYKGTNENINGYSNCYLGAKNVLTVIGSGDQVLNAIYYNAKNIDAFDISSFASYFLKLKIGAVKELSYYDYLDFFCGLDAFDDKRFYKIVNSLDDETKYFWTSICKDVKPSDVYSSYLFSRWKPTEQNSVDRNPCLASENDYKDLKSRIDNSKITTINEDKFCVFIMKLDKNYKIVERKFAN